MNSVLTRRINIVHICDENYLIPTKTLINSIIANKDVADDLRIVIVGVGIKPSELCAFAQVERTDVRIEVIAPENYFDDIAIEHVHVSKAALYKLRLPELLPDMDKVIYLDSDMIVTGSLYDLYSVDLQDMYAAVVRDFIGEKYQEWNHKLHTEVYFNSGMLVLNLEKMREDTISEELVRVRRADLSTAFMDQNTLNTVMDGYAVCVSPIYNYMLSVDQFDRSEVAEFFGITDNEMEGIQKKPIVIHYTNRIKPWNSTEAEKWELWFRYLCGEDLESVLARIFVNTNKQLHDIQEKNHRLMRINNILKNQADNNVNYYENGISINEDLLVPSEKMLFRHRDEIVTATKNLAKERNIVIYGAGRMGQLVYKILCDADMKAKICGFAVSDEQGNVASLFGKKVQLLEQFESENDVMIWAVKGDYSGDGKLDVMDINLWL